MFGGKRFGNERFERRGFRPRAGFQQRGPPPQQRPAGRPDMQAQQGHEISRESRVVIPGELLSSSPRPMPNAFIDQGKTYSSVMGLYDDASGRLVPLEGCYLPNLDDTIVGVVTTVKFSGYSMDLKSPYLGFLSTKETRDEFKLGDIVAARVKDVDEVKNVDLTDASRLEKGEIIEVHSVKIPRIIGKNSSMIRMIQDSTKSEIVVGKNGRIWIRGGNSALAVEAILKIEKEAHTHGLTDRVGAMLKASAPNVAKPSEASV